MPVSASHLDADALADDAPLAPGEVAAAHQLLITWSVVRAVAGFIAAGVFATAVGFGTVTLVEDFVAAAARATARGRLASRLQTGGVHHRGRDAVVVESIEGFALVVDGKVVAVGAR
jgi:hypothetical protein